MKRIILITGGQRSGKSRQAEEMALSLSPHPVYMATAHVWDEEFRRRVAVHQARRGSEWTNIEEEKFLSRHDVAGRVVLIDCCTLWATNFFSESGGADGPDVDAVLQSCATSYPILHYTESFDRFQTGYVPTTVFLDGAGKTLHEPIPGSKDYAGWEALVLKYLK